MNDKNHQSIVDAISEGVKDYHLVITAVVLGSLPPLFFLTGGYVSRMFTLFVLFSIFGIALNIAFGHTDQLFLFVGGITGLSAYSTALLVANFGISPWYTVLPSAVLVGLIGAIVSFTAAKRQVTIIVIAILTLTLQRAILEILVGAREITRGSTGFPFEGFNFGFLVEAFDIHPAIVLYYLLAALLLLVLLIYRKMMNSKYGLAFDVIRQDEVGAEAAGINVVKHKTLAGFITTFIIGLAAPFYIQLEGYVLPGLFQFGTIDVLVLVMLVLGGLRTMYGPVLGAAIILLLNEQLAECGRWRTVIFGFMLMALFLFFREGIVPYIKDIVTNKLQIQERLQNMTG